MEQKTVQKSNGVGRILVVDDETDILKFVEIALTKSGYFVQITADPLEALNLLKENDFDVAIIDLKMPEMDGSELLERIKNKHSKTEVIIVTAHASIETAVDCIKKGASNYLMKPFEMKELITTVDRAVEIGSLKSQLVSLKEMDKLKDEFISTISHELKTPLMAISGAIEILSEQEKVDEKREAFRAQTDKEVQKLTEIISRQTYKMKSLVNDLLDFAKMEAGFIGIKDEEVSVVKVVDESVNEVKPLMDKKKIDISLSNSLSDTFNIKCSHQHLKRVITNLLGNSVKYTHEGGKIAVDIIKTNGIKKSEKAAAPDFVLFSVADNGIGIAKENLKEVFGKFYRVDQSLTREAGGFGLGLSICKKIVELYDGKIWAESGGLGKGSKFTFILPI
ncbi:MAG: response regulator [Elusimicrobia bacterium]|nr:response regulator [Elusimicrobiota bacterium]